MTKSFAYLYPSCNIYLALASHVTTYSFTIPGPIPGEISVGMVLLINSSLAKFEDPMQLANDEW